MSEDISSRTTRSNKIPEINSLYVYKTKHTIKFTHRKQLGDGYRYTEHRAILNAGEGEIHIYHQTATINGVTNGITLVTKNAKSKDVQKWFKEQVKLIEENAGLFNKFKLAKYTPSLLGIRYEY